MRTKKGSLQKKPRFSLSLSNDSNFLQPCFLSVMKVLSKVRHQTKLKASNVPLWLKQSMQKSIFRKLLNLEFFRNLCGLYLCEKNLKLWSYKSYEVIKKNQSNEV